MQISPGESLGPNEILLDRRRRHGSNLEGTRHQIGSRGRHQAPEGRVRPPTCRRSKLMENPSMNGPTFLAWALCFTRSSRGRQGIQRSIDTRYLNAELRVNLLIFFGHFGWRVMSTI